VFAFDTRLQGNFGCHKRFYEDMKQSFTLHFDGYLTSESGYFLLAGLVHNRFRDIDVSETRPNVQVGAYWQGNGALRFGMFQGGPGAALDYWLSYERLQWLTSVEVFGSKLDNDYRYFYKDLDRRPFVRWLNRIFLTDHLYFTFGLNHFYDTTGFAGIGIAF
jgi:hypothetical protein